MTKRILCIVFGACLMLKIQAWGQPAQDKVALQPPTDLAEFFRPSEKYRSDFGPFRSPLRFTDNTVAKTPEDWLRRRKEILESWHKAMGPWPALIENPRF